VRPTQPPVVAAPEAPGATPLLPDETGFGPTAGVPIAAGPDVPGGSGTDTSLPRTGLDVRPLLLIASLCMISGGFLLLVTSVPFRRFDSAV
jgi:hypothetical protein